MTLERVVQVQNEHGFPIALRTCIDHFRSIVYEAKNLEKSQQSSQRWNGIIAAWCDEDERLFGLAKKEIKSLKFRKVKNSSDRLSPYENAMFEQGNEQAHSPRPEILAANSTSLDAIN